jgi:anti-sigma B factor antagonist
VIHIEREFGADPRQLAELRAVIRDALLREWADTVADGVIDRIEIGVQEAAANIVRHAYRDGAGNFRLALEADPDRVVLTLSHEGDDYDPTAVPPPSFDGSRFGGFGLYLIDQCMDEVRHIHGEPGRRGIRLARGRAAPRAEKPMNVIVEQFGDVWVATVAAEALDVSNADDVRTDLEPVLREATKVVLDLSRVGFVDSRGCGVILSCLKQLAGKGGDLKLCRVTPAVRTVFDLIRLHKMCDIHDTREQAVAAFRG